MVTVVYVQHDGTRYELQGEPGDNVMRVALMNGLDGIVGECGGSMMCATCHCHVDEAWLDRTGDRMDGEDDMLDCAASPVDDRSRLSCQITLTADMDGLVVHLPEHQA